MHDSQAFESQVQAAYHQWARAMPTDVDALTFVRETRAVATRGRRRWLSSRARDAGDSAPPRPVTRFPAAGLIAVVAAIAIGTGAVIVVGGQPPSMLPAWTPPPGLVEEVIAPGITLVTSDGAAHRLAHTESTDDVTFAPDGSIWVISGDVLARIGHDGTYPAPRTAVHFSDLTAAPDGVLWALANDTVASFRQGDWVDAPPFPGGQPAKALEVLPNGQVWARSTTTLARLDGDDWTAFAIHGSLGPITDDKHVFPGDLAWTPDGSFWLTVCEGGDRSSLLRFSQGTWTSVAIPGASDDVRCVLPLATGPGGSLWAYLVQDPPAVAVHEGDAWRVSPADAAIPSIAGPGGYVGAMVVGHDGRLWAIGPGGDGRGDLLGVFDGATWSDVYVSESQDTTLLEHPLKVAPDGSIWVQMDDGLLVVIP